MKTNLSTQPLQQIETDVLVLPLFDKEPKISGTAAELDKLINGALTDLVSAGEFVGRAGETALLHRPAGIKARRLLVIGMGKGQSAPGTIEWQRMASLAARQLKAKGFHQIAIALPDFGDRHDQEAAAIQAVTTGTHAANFDPDKYKSDRKEDRRIDALVLALPAARAGELARLEGVLRRADALAAGLLFAREMANEPSNYLTPTIMAQRAQSMAREAGLQCELIDAARARELKMGAFLSVAQGSAEPPVMMVLRYHGAGEGQPYKLALIGKGITFDTGGISIKPAAGMEWMKFDMAGGAATLGAMKAIAALKPRINVLAIVPASENMPGGKAQKPGDVQRAMSGKTIEVLNTDAEGRLVLADAMCYARELGAQNLVDSATLTGAVVIALGNVNTGVFCNNEEFYGKFQEAARRSGEKMWRLPLDAEYFDQIKGTVGDILNTGGRNGGAITAAKFLQEFAGDLPWIHLDIAGTAWLESDKPYMPSGPTGTPLYTLVELAELMAS